MAVAFEDHRPSPPIAAPDDHTWEEEIDLADRAVSTLLDLKREMLRTDPQYELVLWSRHRRALQHLKRKMDAVCT